MIWNTVHTIENTAGDVISLISIISNQRLELCWVMIILVVPTWTNILQAKNPQGISKTDALVTAMRQRSLKLN